MARSSKSLLCAVLVLLIGGGLAAAHFLLPGGLPASLGLGPARPSEPYACPMPQDAEVRSDKPGRCPRCGMNLVPLSEAQRAWAKSSPAGGKPATAPPAQGKAEAAGSPAHEGHAAMEGMKME